MLPIVFNRAGTFTFDRLYDLRREIDRIFEGVEGVEGGSNGTAHWVPPMDIEETTDAILCKLEVPGLNPADLDVNVENNVITISGEKKPQFDSTDEKTGYRHMERRYGRFQRSFSLPQTVDAGAVGARYDNGILTVTLPKAELAKPRKVAIENGPTPRN